MYVFAYWSHISCIVAAKLLIMVLDVKAQAKKHVVPYEHLNP